MAYFIKVTRSVNSSAALVNLDNVFAISLSPNSGARFHSVGGDKDGGSVTFTVRESIAEIEAQIPDHMKEANDDI